MAGTMSLKIRNALGNEVVVRPEIGPELMACGRRLTEGLMKHPEIIGTIAGGSCVSGAADGFSDLDLYVFGVDKNKCQQEIHECCLKIGGQLDPDGTSIHFPLDSPGYLFRDLYLEPGATTIRDVVEELEGILSAKKVDEGRIFSLRNGELLADRAGEVKALQARLCAATVSREYADWYASIALDVPLKLLIHSVYREDYPQACHWLQRLYFECTRIVFARNRCFFPGTKRTLLHLEGLPSVPEGFIQFWGRTLLGATLDWHCVLEHVQRLVPALRSS